MTYIKIKMCQRYKYKIRNIKTLEESIGEKLCDFVFCDEFLDTPPKHDLCKKINKTDFIKIENFALRKSLTKE